MGKTAFQGRNLGRAAKIYDAMLQDKECTIILCLTELLNRWCFLRRLWRSC
ncbi:deoxyhypusine synthase family protein [Nostoc sp.]|uniref:deoxyhypusine synthase family protein n=1 Tax=Nostoc sp. TaxID=1180 RepID=UPI002FF9DABF